MTGDALIVLMRQTLADPRRGLRAVLALPLPDWAGLAALGLMAVGSALMLHLSLGLMPEAERALGAALFGAPLVTAVLQFAVLLGSTVLIQVLGRGAGGQGRFGQALIAMAWLQFLMLALQAVQIVLLLALPPLSGFVGLAAVGLFFWLLTAFITELHGFSSPAKVFGAILAVLLLLALALSTLLMAVIGPEAMSHV